MIKNHFFKTILSIKPEILIAQTLDASGAPTPGVPGVAAAGTASVTVASTPTLADQLVITVGSKEFAYPVGAGDTTAAAFGTNLLAYLNGAPGSADLAITWTKAGTTSLVLTATANATGTALNGTIVQIKAGSVNAGPTFSSMSATNFSGGVNAIDGFQSTYANFLLNAANGALAAYWEDTRNAVQTGDTLVPANQGRKFFYAVKQSDGTVRITTPLPVAGLKYSSQAYVAGTLQIGNIAFGGTASTNQYIHAKIIDTTPTVVPYPTYEYIVQYGQTYKQADGSSVTASSLTNVVTILADMINRETVNPIVTATASTTTLTVTGIDATTTFKLLSSLETVPGATTDASAFVNTSASTPGVAPVGNNAYMLELEKAMIVMAGGIIYADGIANVAEYGTMGTNVLTSINYGILVTSTPKTESGATRDYTQKARVIIALPTASLAALAAL